MFVVEFEDDFAVVNTREEAEALVERLRSISGINTLDPFIYITPTCTPDELLGLAVDWAQEIGDDDETEADEKA